MFGRRRSSIVGRGLQVVGKVTAEGLVKVYGQIDGELRCASLIVSRNGHVKGKIKAGKAVIDGKVEGPIEAIGRDPEVGRACRRRHSSPDAAS